MRQSAIGWALPLVAACGVAPHVVCPESRATSIAYCGLGPAHDQTLAPDESAEARRLADPGRAPDEVAMARQIQAALETAIRSLDPEQREVILLRDVEGLKAAEVGRVLGIGVAAVKSRLHRARMRVREQVAPRLGVHEPSAAVPAGCPNVLTLYSSAVESSRA